MVIIQPKRSILAGVFLSLFLYLKYNYWNKFKLLTGYWEWYGAFAKGFIYGKQRV